MYQQSVNKTVYKQGTKCLQSVYNHCINSVSSAYKTVNKTCKYNVSTLYKTSFPWCIDRLVTVTNSVLTLYTQCLTMYQHSVNKNSV